MKKIRNHADVDVKPWIELGNSPLDTTKTSERICAMSHSSAGRGALLYLGYNYDYCNQSNNGNL